MYVLAKFQLYILKAFEVTALQSYSNRKIDLYSKHRENKLQALPKMDVTYKWSEIGTRILHHHVCHELRNRVLVSYSFYCPASPLTKLKSVKKHQSRMTTLTPRELKRTSLTIPWVHCNQTKNFELLLLGQIQ